MVDYFIGCVLHLLSHYLFDLLYVHIKLFFVIYVYWIKIYICYKCLSSK